MRNIWTIFTRDIRKIRTNVIALIVVLGVTVVPCLYAWFNIAASWDPYGNTGNLKVAVASVDEGYTGNLIPLQLNLGDQVCLEIRSSLLCIKILSSTGFLLIQKMLKKV